MGNYSRPTRRFDRRPAWKFCAMPLLVQLALAAGCASMRPGERTETVGDGDTVPSEIVISSTPAAAPASGAARTVALRARAPASYVVKKGDTLWDIASHFLLDPWQWPEIWYVNDQVRNPHLIYPGDVLRLMEVDGRTRIGLDVERVSPQVRAALLESAIPTIPIEAIRDFLRGPRLVTPEQLRAAPYLLAFVDEHLLGADGNLIYVRNLAAGEPYNYALVRQGQVYRDPDDGQTIGYEAQPIGDAEIKEYGSPAVALLARTQREARIGDRLLPVEDEPFLADFLPHAPPQPVGGRIIAAFDGVSQISQYQIVAINRGRAHGLEPGHVLQILQLGDKVVDPYGRDRIQLPDQPAGQLLVFKTEDRLSFGLVMSVTRPAHVLDKVEKPRLTR